MTVPKTILLVEDESLIALGERIHLEKEGYKVLLAANGEAAVEIICAKNVPVDLILMDINLGPGMDGTQAARQILLTHDIPIVFLSLHTEKAVVEKTEQITSYGYIVKDSGLTVLFASIKMAFKLFKLHKELQESEDRYRTVVESSPNSILIEREGKIVYVNGAAVSLLDAHGSEELLGLPILDLIPADDRAAFILQVCQFDQNSLPSAQVEKVILTRDGKRLHVEVIMTPITYDGQACVQVTLHDITTRKHAEAALSESEKRYRELFENAPLAISQAMQDGQIIAVNTQFASMFGYASPEEFYHLIKSSEQIYVVPERRQEIIRLRAANPELTTFDNLYRRKDGTTFWGRLNVHTLSSADGRPLSSEGFIEDITGRKTTEEKLRDSEEKYRVFFENEIFGVVMFDQQTLRLLDANDAFLRMYGYAREDLLAGITIPDLTAEEEISRSAIQRSIQHGSEYVPMRWHRRKDGSTFPVELIGGTHVWRGQPVLFAIARDITVRTNALRDLNESEARYRALFEHIEEGFVLLEGVYDEQGQVMDLRLLEVNQACLNILGFDLTQWIGQTIREAAPFFPVDILQRYLQVVQTGTPLNEEIYAPEISRYLNTKAFCPQPGRLAATIENITQIRETDLALRESEAKYRALFENSLYAIKIFDQEGLRILDANDAFLRLYGYEREELLAGTTLLDLSAEPEATIASTNQVSREGSVFVPLRYHRKKDGTVFPIEIAGSPLVWRGQPAMFSVEHDISERINAEKKLKESEKRFRALFEQTHDAVFIDDLQMRCVMANQRAANMLGYTIEELLALSSVDTSAEPEQNPIILERLLAGENIPPYERLFRKKDGQVFPVEINAEMVRDADGNPLHIQSMARDISQRKQTEAEIQKLLAEKALLMREVHHRIKNNMSAISGLLTFQAEMLPDPGSKQALYEANQRVLRMQEIYDRLYLTGNYLELNAREYLSALTADIDRTWQLPNRQIRLKMEIADIPLGINLSFPLGIFLNECITNAYKYAFPGDRDGVIRVSLEQAGGTLQVAVADDGVGLPEEISLDAPSGFGLTLLSMMALQVDGQLSVTRDHGTCFHLAIPIEG